uniref:Uncharacterized protein n=1 Tax=Trichogramma kaykai TaxID=54128 RepID=A0ABD2WDT1_9HYME
MLTDMTPAAAGQLYPQLQSISKSPVHGHVTAIRMQVRVHTRRDACLHMYKRYKRSILSSIGRLRALDIWSVCSRAYVYYALDAARRTNFLFYDPPPAAAARNFFLHTRAQYLEISLSYYCYSVGPAAPIVACDSQKVIAGGIFAGYATRCRNHNIVEEPLYTRARGKVVSAARRLLPIHTLAAGHSESRLPRELADVITPHEEPELDYCSGMSESLIRPYHAKSHRLFSRELRSTAVLLSSLSLSTSLLHHPDLLLLYPCAHKGKRVRNILHTRLTNKNIQRQLALLVLLFA